MATISFFACKIELCVHMMGTLRTISPNDLKTKCLFCAIAYMFVQDFSARGGSVYEITTAKQRRVRSASRARLEEREKIKACMHTLFQPFRPQTHPK